LSLQQNTLQAQQVTLANQQAFLSSLQTYVTSTNSQLQGNSYAAQLNRLGSQSITFYAPRTVVAQVTSAYNFSADAADTAGNYGAWFFLNSVRDESNNMICGNDGKGLLYGHGGGFMMMRNGTTAQSQGVYTFAQGWHTLTATWDYTLVGGGSSGWIYLYGRTLTVSIIG